MLHLLNPADRAEQIRFLKQLEKEREEEMTIPQIYILVEGGVVQEVRLTHDLAAHVTVFDLDNIKAEYEDIEHGQREECGLTWDDAAEHSKAVW